MPVSGQQEQERQEWIIECMQIITSGESGLPRLVTLFLALDEDSPAEYVARMQLELLGKVRKLRRRKKGGVRKSSQAALPRGDSTSTPTA